SDQSSMKAVIKTSRRKSQTTTVSTRGSKPISSCRVTRKRIHKPTRIAQAAIKEIVFKQVTCQAEIHPNEDYGVFDPSRRLYEDPTLSTHTNAGKQQFWYFILTLLMDSSKKDVISWTGNRTEFIISSITELMSLWSINQTLEKMIKKDTLLRNFRACYKRRVMIPVSAQKYRFAFITEPSIHIGMTQEELADFIAIHSLNLPSMKIRRKLPEVDCIYPTPPSSTSEYINSFNPLSPSTVPYSNTVLAPMSHYPESNNFLNAHFAQPHPIHFNNIDPSYESYWIPPTPIMPQFVDHFQYQNADENYMYQSGCKNENINY
ncbi:hypothetical protein PRIPAC_72527, partial [Pristionchus pacificus]|uniref:ETS domain-containing protein n=1 Tax=Pristionchus pacificus TaxID=54126 RepID=A0A2A6C1Q4_PRIPA